MRQLELLLSAERDVEHGSGATEREILAATRSLGDLPDEYLQLLRRFGWLVVRHYTLRGLGAGLPAYLDLVATTRDEHDNFGLPRNLIAFSDDGGGNQFVFDQKRLTSGSGPVLLWLHDAGPEEPNPNEVGATFSQWMIDRLTP